MPLVSNENVSEAVGVLAVLPPGSVAVGTATIGPFNSSPAMRVLFLVQLATPSGGATTDFRVQASATSGGTYTNVAGAAITQITAGTNPVFQVEVKGETLAGAGQGPWLKGVLTVGAAAQVASGLALTGPTHYAPASDNNVANVVQTVVV